jgi:hypothetical protein
MDLKFSIWKIFGEIVNTLLQTLSFLLLFSRISEYFLVDTLLQLQGH